MKKILNFIYNLPKELAVLAIKAYQLLLSPDHSWLKARYPYGYCRHFPSCSEYAKQSIIKFGFLKGLALALNRLRKCHPWAESKFDPVPKTFFNI